MKKLLVLIMLMLLALCACGEPAAESPAPEAEAPAASEPSATEAEAGLDEMTADVISRIITDGMSDEQKARAVYDWAAESLRYSARSSEGDWRSAAEFGLSRLSGDCVIYFAVTKALLNAAGLETTDVEHTAGTHIWNLVKIDGEWYHIDTTPQSDGSELFLKTDAELSDYSAAHEDSHVWDASAVPATP